MCLTFNKGTTGTLVRSVLQALRDLVASRPEDASLRDRLAGAVFKSLTKAVETETPDLRDALLQELRDLATAFPEDSKVRESLARGLLEVGADWERRTLSDDAAERKLKVLTLEICNLAGRHPDDHLLGALTAGVRGADNGRYMRAEEPEPENLGQGRRKGAVRTPLGHIATPVWGNASMQTDTDRLTTVSFENSRRLLASMEVIVNHMRDGTGRVTLELEKALKFLGFDLYVASHRRDAYSDHDEYVALVPLSTDGQQPTLLFREDPDFHDLSRKLTDAIRSLTEYIRGLNDPEIATPQIKSVVPFLEAFQAFLKTAEGGPADEIPSAIPKGLLHKLKQVNWEKVSDHAHKWVETIIGAVGKYLSSGPPSG